MSRSLIDNSPKSSHIIHPPYSSSFSCDNLDSRNKFLVSSLSSPQTSKPFLQTFTHTSSCRVTTSDVAVICHTFIHTWGKLACGRYIGIAHTSLSTCTRSQIGSHLIRVVAFRKDSSMAVWRFIFLDCTFQGERWFTFSFVVLRKIFL